MTIVVRRSPSLQGIARSLASAIGVALMPLTTVLSAAHAVAAAPERFVVFYGQDAAPGAFAPYRRAVLDADHHPALAPLQASGVELFGYLSLGEVNDTRTYYKDAAASGLLLGPNPNWPGAQYVDLRKATWRGLLMDRVIPNIVDQGFSGLFLDTLDDAGFLEQTDPVGNAGMVAAAADLLRAIHARFPSLKLMLNRAFDVGVLAAPELDSVLAESLLSDFDFKTHQYRMRPEADVKWGLSRVAELRRLNPHLRVYTLDYWNPSDQAGMRRLYDRERRAGFVPYVATIDLQNIVPEPRR